MNSMMYAKADKAGDSSEDLLLVPCTKPNDMKGEEIMIEPCTLNEFHTLGDNGDWSQFDHYLDNFLSALGLENLSDLLKKKDVHFFQLISSSDQDLKDMGIVAQSVRKKILREVTRFHKITDLKLAFPCQDSNDEFTMSDAVDIGSNLFLQLEILKRAVMYLRKKYEAGPVLLPMQRECQYSTITLALALKSQLQCKYMTEELAKLAATSKKLQSLDEFVAPDLIAEWWEQRKKAKEPRFTFKYYAGLLVITGAMCFFYRTKLIKFSFPWTK